jgi:hypothetical protein
VLHAFRARGRPSVASSPTAPTTGVENDVDIVALHGVDETLRTNIPTCVGLASIRDNADEARLELRNLLLQKPGIVEGCERSDAKTATLALEHAERRGADRSRRTENRDPARTSAHVGAHMSMNPNKT